MSKAILNVISILATAGLALAAEPTQTPAPAAPASTNGLGPKIAFETPVFDFGKAKEGDLVKHSYIFTNIGDGLLEVSAVQPSCGCTTAGEWTHKVEPGKCGTIAIQFNTAHQNPSVFKTITVTCNDKGNPRPVLQLKGTIWKPIEITPQFAVLNVTADAPHPSMVVRVVNNQDEPLTLSPPESNNKAFVPELKTIQPGKEYQVTVTAQPPLTPGNVSGQITLKTTATNMPVISITAFANVTPPVVVSPQAVGLPPAPLLAPQTNTVSIIFNSTNVFSLSDPEVNDSRVDVQLKEVQAGKKFAATLIFPEGFDVAQGKQVELTMKSTSPGVPLVKVPISQAPRLAKPPLMPVKAPLTAPRVVPPPQPGTH